MRDENPKFGNQWPQAGAEQPLSSLLKAFRSMPLSSACLHTACATPTTFEGTNDESRTYSARALQERRYGTCPGAQQRRENAEALARPRSTLHPPALYPANAKPAETKQKMAGTKMRAMSQTLSCSSSSSLQDLSPMSFSIESMHFLCGSYALTMWFLCTFYVVPMRFLYRVRHGFPFNTRHFSREYGEWSRSQKKSRPQKPLQKPQDASRQSRQDAKTEWLRYFWPSFFCLPLCSLAPLREVRNMARPRYARQPVGA